jgi:hypothetical protein
MALLIGSLSVALTVLTDVRNLVASTETRDVAEAARQPPCVPYVPIAANRSARVGRLAYA